jgi:excisionase family DNA binding protein
MMEKKLLSLSETATYLGMSRSWLYQQVEQKMIPHLRLGSAIRFDLDVVNEWLYQHCIMKHNNR